MDIWSSFWQGPRLSCVQSGSGIGYPDTLKSLWHRFFESVADGSRVLDIGTGNGAVAIMARETARKQGRNFEIHAADRSDIDPPKHLRGTGLVTDGIIFHAATPAEKTPFLDASFDVVTGQYALEYTDMAATIEELARVLKRGARVRFVIHMLGSRVYEQTRRQIRDLEFIRIDLELLNRARAMMAAVYACESNADSGDAALEEMNEAKRRFFQAATQVQNASQTAAYRELYAEVLQILAHYWNGRRRYSLKTFLDRVDELERDLSMAERRHRAMCESALDAAALRVLAARFEHSGFTQIVTRRIQTEDDGVLLGWELDARLRDSNAI